MSFQEDPEVQQLFIKSLRLGKAEEARLRECGITLPKEPATPKISIRELMANEHS